MLSNPSTMISNHRTLHQWVAILGPEVLQIFNRLPDPHKETLEPSYPLTPVPNPIVLPSIHPERLSINITVNCVCRILSILDLGFGGGWSCLPDSEFLPCDFHCHFDWLVNLHICVQIITLTDVSFCRIAMTAVLDCPWPTAMDWYFRSPLQAKFLCANAPSPVKITLYWLGNTFLAFGHLLAWVIKRQDV